jgi:hypothetical protein
MPGQRKGKEMLIKAGVDISRLRPEIRKQLTIIARIVDAIENEDYANLAVDIRIYKKAQTVKTEIARELGQDYFVYLAKHCIHVGYDPK